MTTIHYRHDIEDGLRNAKRAWRDLRPTMVRTAQARPEALSADTNYDVWLLVDEHERDRQLAEQFAGMAADNADAIAVVEHRAELEIVDLRRQLDVDYAARVTAALPLLLPIRNNCPNCRPAVDVARDVLKGKTGIEEPR